MPGKGLQILNGLQTEGPAEPIQDEGACAISLSDTLGVSKDGSAFQRDRSQTLLSCLPWQDQASAPLSLLPTHPHRQGTPRRTVGSKLKAEEETEQNDTGWRFLVPNSLTVL